MTNNPIAKAVEITPDFMDEEFDLRQLSLRVHPILPAVALFGLAGDIAKAATADSEADPAAVLATVLVYAGAAFGNDVYVNVGETKHPPRLFVAIVGASSRARKGTSYNPVHRIFTEAGKTYSLAAVGTSPGPTASGEGLIYRVRDASEVLDKETNLPIDPGVQDKRVLVIEGELANALKVMQREGNTLSTTIRGFWDCGTVEPLTKNNRIKCTNAHLNLIGHITNYELKQDLKGAEISNGYSNRFIWIAARRQKLVSRPLPMADEAVALLAKKLAGAVQHAHDTSVMPFSEEATAEWDRRYPALTTDKAGTIGSVTSRAEAQVIRLALIYALLDFSVCIKVEHLIAAYAFWDYANESAAYIFGDTTSDDDAYRVLQALAAGEKSQSEIRDLFNRNKSGDSLNSLLTSLEGSGRITQRREKGKGRPTIYWHLTKGFEKTS